MNDTKSKNSVVTFAPLSAGIGMGYPSTALPSTSLGTGGAGGAGIAVTATDRPGGVAEAAEEKAV